MFTTSTIASRQKLLLINLAFFCDADDDDASIVLASVKFDIHDHF